MLGLFDHVVDLKQAAVETSVCRFNIQYPIGGDAGPLHDLRRDHRTLRLLEDAHHLLQARLFGINQIVGQKHCEGLFAYQFTRHQHRMPQP